MQLFSVLTFVSVVAAIAVRQDIPPPPQCAFSCLTNTDTHGCSITDNSCLCRNAQFIADQAACITQACPNPSDLQQADTFAQQNCLQAGVTLTSVPTATGSGSAPSATSPSTSAPAPTKSNAAPALSGTAPALLLTGVAIFAFAL